VPALLVLCGPRLTVPLAAAGFGVVRVTDPKPQADAGS
jgi:hypothetical protein